MTVRIVTDSVACVPRHLATELDVDVVPMHLVLDGDELRDGVDITAEEFYTRLPEVGRASTAAPSAGEYLDRFEAAAAAGYDEVLVLPLASRLSASCANARIAARDAPLPVEVLDTGTAAAAQFLVVTAAAAVAREVTAAPDALARARTRARTAMDATRVVGVVPLLARLERQSGRIAQVVKGIGGRLDLVPVLTIRGSTVRPAGITRSVGAAVERMAAMLADVGPCRLAVTHAGAPERAETLQARLSSLLDAREQHTVAFTPVMGVHTGPGVLGVAWEALSA